MRQDVGQSEVERGSKQYEIFSIGLGVYKRFKKRVSVGWV